MISPHSLLRWGRARLGDLTGRTARELRRELDSYMHAFETTAADRDRLAGELQQQTQALEAAREDTARYMEAFETTAADRDRLAEELEQQTWALAQELESCRSELEKTGADRIRGIEVADRLRTQISTAEAANAKLKHAFTSTATDRNYWKAAANQLAETLNAGEFRVDFDSVRRQAKELTESFTEKLLGHYREECFYEIVSSMFTQLGIRYSLPVADAHLRPFAAYYMASLLAARGDFLDARNFAAELEFNAPPDMTDFLPYDLHQSSRAMHYRHQWAIREKRPGAVITSMPKSASAFLTDGLATIFGVPTLRISLGESEKTVVVPKWAKQIARGGAVTHEHFPGNVLNLQTLSAAGIERVWVQGRDPRDAAYSLLRMKTPRWRTATPTEQQSREESILGATRTYAAWLAEWIAAAAEGEMDIQFITFDQVTRSFPDVVARIAGERMSEEIQARTKDFLQNRPRRNFRKGVGGEWREEFDRAAQDKFWAAIPPNVREKLALER